MSFDCFAHRKGQCFYALRLRSCLHIVLNTAQPWIQIMMTMKMHQMVICKSITNETPHADPCVQLHQPIVPQARYDLCHGSYERNTAPLSFTKRKQHHYAEHICSHTAQEVLHALGTHLRGSAAQPSPPLA